MNRAGVDAQPGAFPGVGPENARMLILLHIFG
jgi:hypothetical protein